MRITKRIEFDAAHRLLGYDGPCARLHGHRYILEVTLEGTRLDELGMLEDFKSVSSKLKEGPFASWDHRTLLNNSDPFVFVISDAYLMDKNPTAENMLLEFVEKWGYFFNTAFTRLHSVKLFETPDCSAELIL